MLYIMFCKNCGKELPEGAKFCSGCGTPVTPAAQEPIEEPTPTSDPIVFPGAGFPGDDAPVPEAPVFDAPAPEEEKTVSEESAPEAEAPQDPVPSLPVSAPVSTPIPAYVPPAADAGAGQSAVKRRGKAGLVVLGGGAVVLILVVALLVKLISGLAGGGSGKAMYAYLNDDGELMYLADLKEKTEALELTDEGGYGSDVGFSPDGKTVYFTDSDSTLYSIAVSELKKGGKPERISRNVGYFTVLKDGRVAYSQYDSGENRLSIYEKGESYRLLRGYSYHEFSEDQKTVYYAERDESDDTLSLYKVAVSKDAKEERLLKGATTIYSDYDADILVYGVNENVRSGKPSYDASSNALTVYSCKPGGDKTKLVDDVQSVTGVKVDGGNVSFYYYIAGVEERTLYDFVTDSKAGEDSRTLSGDRPVNPSWNDYSPRNYYIEDNGTVTYADRNGNRYPIDVRSLLTGDRTVEDLRTYDVSPIAEADARERYNKVKEDYDARISAWNEAQNRENMRENLKNSQYTQISLSLYHYTGSGKGDAIATGIDNTSGRASSPMDGVFLYHKADLESGKVADLEKLDYAGQVREKLQSGEGAEDWYQNVGGKESVIKDLEEVTSVYDIYVLNGKEVVLDVYDGYENSLRAYTLGGDSLTFTSAIIEDDFAGPYWGKSSGKDVLYLFTDMGEERNGTVGDFSVYKDGKLETVAKEIYGAVILDESGTTYVVTDVDSRNNGELALLKNGETTTISDEVSGGMEPIFLDGTQMLYLSDGDLMLWNGKESRRIARDVERVWASTRESCSSYSPYY